MKKLKAKIGLMIVKFGITIMESEPFGLLDDKDKDNLKRLWEYYDKFEAALK